MCITDPFSNANSPSDFLTGRMTFHLKNCTLLAEESENSFLVSTFVMNFIL